MAYDLYDFTESIAVASREGGPITENEIARCAFAFGESPEGGSSWHGGFVCETKAGGWLFVFGWCDYTGWGCQDGAWVCRYPSRPSVEELGMAWDEKQFAPLPLEHGDEDPADVNRYLAGELDRWGDPVAKS